MLVEIKYARSASDFRRIEKEVFEDSVAYQKDRGTYKEIVIFIYDASASNQEHDITAAALLGIEHISDVIIVSRPSQLPAPNAAEKVAPKRRQTMQTPRRTPGTAPVRGDDDSEQAS